MKMSFRLCLLTVPLALLLDPGTVSAQATFQDLSFLAATNLPTIGPTLVPVSNAFPGWTVYEGGVQATQVAYDGVSAGSVAVTLVGTNVARPDSPPLEGNYSATLDGGETGTGLGPAEIAQTGTIPPSTESLFFTANYNVFGYLTLAFNGQNLPYAEVSSTANYQVYGANISEFAGETGLLSFTETPTSSTPFPIAYLNDIQFSNQQIPEPQTWALLLCGAGALAAGRRKQTQ
jgi:hypothetical protein